MADMRFPIRDQESLSKSIHVGSIDELLFGQSLESNRQPRVDPESGTVHLFLKSTSKSAVCPYCGMVSDKPHCTNSRHPQWMPINGMTTYAHIALNRYQCLNAECPQRTFVEELDCAKSYQHRSDLVNTLIFAVSVFCSDVATSMICKEMGILVSHDSANRLLDHIVVEDDPDIEYIGVDDVSSRKGQTYQTVIYAGDDHHLLALLDGRDGKNFKEWLKDHPKINIVARDRASAYASAISEILPDAIQVADRFHILQNLLEYLKDIFKANIPKQIFLRDEKILDGPLEKDYVPVVPLDSPELDKVFYDNTPPVDEYGNEINYCNKNRNENKEVYRKRAEIRKEKHRRIVEMRQEWESSQPCSKKEFSQRHRISIPTLKKYLDMSDEQVDKILEITEYKKRQTDMDHYMNIVFKMLLDGHRPDFIYSYIIHNGYEGSQGSLTDNIKSIALNNFGIRLGRNFHLKAKYPDDVVIVRRADILKYITAKDKARFNDTSVAKYFDVIRQAFPIVETCSEIWDAFYSILMGDDPDKLDPFLEHYEDSLITPFINGVKKDIAPVKNAISSSVSSGFVEGGNCRYKATKRLMFGRSGIDHLFRKAYAISIIMRTEKTSSSLIENWLGSKSNYTI